MALAPRIPYIEIDDWVLMAPGTLAEGLPPIPISIKPFGVLVAVGVYLGGYLALLHGKRSGLDEVRLRNLIFTVVLAGFVGGHFFDTLFYFPERVLEDPLSLFRLWEGLSSLGGFSGALIGLLVFRVFSPGPLLRYADSIVSALPVGWVFGRAGCAVAHDHPGLLSELWFAVAYPGGGRVDLGLCEMVLTIPLAVIFLHLRRRNLPVGFYTSVAAVTYAPWRFCLDWFRAQDLSPADARYMELTPAQWACLGLWGAGVWLTVKSLNRDDDSVSAVA